MILVEKTPEEIQSDKGAMDLLINEYSVVHKGHLQVQEEAEKAAKIEKVSCEPITQESIIEEKMTLSVSILKPDMSDQELAAMDQKEQLLVIMEHLKTTGVIPHILKVGLFVRDLSTFKQLNAEYVKYFGLKPPVRVCVEIPGNEVIASFVIWKKQPEVDFSKLQ